MQVAISRKDQPVVVLELLDGKQMSPCLTNPSASTMDTKSKECDINGSKAYKISLEVVKASPEGSSDACISCPNFSSQSAAVVDNYTSV